MNRNELFKAVKYEVVNFYTDHGCNLAMMWKVIKGRVEGIDKDFWIRTCLDDYRTKRV
jgi:hypothetical protein